MQDKEINDYCKEISDEFVNRYIKELDEAINKMLGYFGFKEEKEDSGKWLIDNKYQLLMDEELKDDRRIKTIFLFNEKINRAVAVIIVEISNAEENLTFRISDVFVSPEVDD